MVTYSVPFWKGSALGGIVTLDLEFSPAVRAAFASPSSFEESYTCWSCDFTCTHSYRAVNGHISRAKICNRCYTRGLLPPNTSHSDLVHVMSGACFAVGPTAAAP